MPVSTVAPVVVRPDMLSNKASVKPMCGAVASIRGKAPARAARAQKAVAMTKPSRVRRLPLQRRSGSHKAKPMPEMNAKAARKGNGCPSSAHHANNQGGNSVTLKIIRKSPRTRRT